jgi:hypothetical protein
MKEQLFISKELFLRLNKMLAVIRLSTNSRFYIQLLGTSWHPLNCSNGSSAYQSHLRRSNCLNISESNNNKHSKIINHVVLNSWNQKAQRFPILLTYSESTTSERILSLFILILSKGILTFFSVSFANSLITCTPSSSLPIMN